MPKFKLMFEIKIYTLKMGIFLRSANGALYRIM